MAVSMSIVIPTYNCLNYLKLCLASLEKNSMVEHEPVIVCDNCTDGTQQWLRDNQYAYFELSVPHAPSAEAAWNNYTYAFDKCTKDYICFANDDLWWGPMWDEHVSEHLTPVGVTALTLVEPGVFGKPWRGIIEKNFGENFKNLDVAAFEAFCNQQPAGVVEKEGVDICTIWHRNYFATFMPEGWGKLGPTILDHYVPFKRVTNANAYHFSGKARNQQGDRGLQ